MESISPLFGPKRLADAMKGARGQPGLSLSDPTLRYIAALYDPRQCYEAASVPVQSQYSQKSRIFVRGQLSTGTTGYGFITAKPNAANDNGSVTYTGPTSVMTSATLLSAATLTTTADNNSSYASAAITGASNTLTTRIVAAGLYVRYAGTELNRGGDILLFEEPNHLNAQSYSFNSMLGQDATKRIPVTSEWVHVSFTPNTVAEATFVGSQYGPFNSNSNCLAIALASATASAQPFDFEYYQHVEYVGSTARSSTVSFDDVVGHSLVSGACTMFSQLDCTLGLDGFMRAIHAQASNMSGAKVVGAVHGNYVGLLPFLPLLKQLVPKITNMAPAALKGVAAGVVGGVKAYNKANKKK